MTTKRRTKSVSSSVIICTILTTPQRTKRCAEHLPAGALNEALKLRIFAMPMFTVPESSPGKLNRLHAGASCFKNAAGRRPVLRRCAQLQRCGHHELAQPSRFTRRWEIKAALLAHCAVYPADNTPARLKSSRATCCTETYKTKLGFERGCVFKTSRHRAAGRIMRTLT